MRTRCASMLLVGVIAPPIWLASACQTRGQSSANRPPIIDMHLHAHSLSRYGGGMPNCANDQEILYPGADPREPFSLGRLKTCASPMPAAATDELLMKESLVALERHNIFAVTAGPLVNVRAWRAAAARSNHPRPPVRRPRLARRQRVPSLGATTANWPCLRRSHPQYEGMTLDDSRWDPYYALAEELDIPVGVHLGKALPVPLTGRWRAIARG